MNKRYCDCCNLPTENAVGFLSEVNTGYNEAITCNCDPCEKCGYIHAGFCRKDEYQFGVITDKPKINEDEKKKITEKEYNKAITALYKRIDVKKLRFEEMELDEKILELRRIQERRTVSKNE